jgi:hypothetical protein
MHTITTTVVGLIGLLEVAAVLMAQQSKALYENNFEKAELGKVPDEFLVLDGGFAVHQEDGNKFLELPGTPISDVGSGLMFGPTGGADVAVSARVYGTAKGRRYPAFAIGLNGQGLDSYRLQISPAKKLLELFKGEEVQASVPYEWQSGNWTMLQLQVRKVKEGEWKVEGKAWSQTGKEPATWLVSLDEKKAPPAGRATVWGSPYATTPIRFDDLKISPAGH